MRRELNVEVQDINAKSPNPAVERDGHKLRLWFPTLRYGRPSLLRYQAI